MKDVFYEQGLKFSCKRCSSCCRYDAGYVYLSVLDIDRLAAKLEIEKDNFIKVYCRWIENYHNNEILSLKEKANKDCIFWDDGCTVYEERPLQCKLFPFWESILFSKENWKIAATGCPGMDSGKLHSREEIASFLEMRLQEKIFTRKPSGVLKKEIL